MSSLIRVLLVEDNPGDAYLARDILASGSLTLELTIVSDGTEAIEYLLQRGKYADTRPPDLVVLDLNLPKLDGREVLRAIRAHEQLKLTPVVVLTSSESPQDVAGSYALGANCFVTKPLDLAAYRQTVGSIERFWLSVARLP